MSKVGIATLPLHKSKAPRWLLTRMVMLGKPIFKIVHDMEGPDGIINRLSDTYWFQGLACILGFDWHSSGCTTVLGGILKQIITPEEYGLIVAGGKGKYSKKVHEHLTDGAKVLDYSPDNVEKFTELSRLVAKIDNTAIQDGFKLYHHMMILSEHQWGIIQQGLDPTIKQARRYHWHSEGLKNFLNNPHSSIHTQIIKPKVLDMASTNSQESRKISLDLIAEGSNRIKRYLLKLKDNNQKTIDDFINPKNTVMSKRIPHLEMPVPFTLKWETLDMARNLALNDYTNLLKVKGIGPGTIRALALISEFIWGTSPSWRDPAKYSFAHGGKDGIPYPVHLKRMERNASLLEEAIDRARLGDKEKLNALKRLHMFKNNNVI